MQSKFSVDDHSHYLFTPRDLTKWVLGLLRYDLESQSLFEVWYDNDNNLSFFFEFMTHAVVGHMKLIEYSGIV